MGFFYWQGAEMKNRHSRAAFIALALGAILVFYRRNQSEAVDERLSAVSATPLAKSDRLQALVRLPRASAKPVEAVVKNDPISPECRTQWKMLNDLNLQRYLDNSETLPAELAVGKACNNLPKSFTVPTGMLENGCKPSNPTAPLKSRELQHQACYQSLVIYRAMIADFDSQDLSADQISDLRLLSDKLIANLFKNLTDGLPYAERLLAIEPNFAPAAKIAAVLQLVSADTKKGIGTIETAKSSLQRAERLDNSDPKFYSALRDSVEMAGADSVTMQIEVAKKQAQAQEGTANAAFLSSFVAFKEGRLAEASRRLADALRADPGNIDYQATQKELQELIEKRVKNPAEHRIYSHSYPLDITQLIP